MNDPPEGIVYRPEPNRQYRQLEYPCIKMVASGKTLYIILHVIGIDSGLDRPDIGLIRLSFGIYIPYELRI